MAQSVDSNATNPAVALRELLGRLERIAVKPVPESVEELLTGMDTVAANLEQLEAAGMDVRAETVRFDNLQRRLASQTRDTARAAARLPGGMDALRTAHPPADAAWWQADHAQAASVRRTLYTVAATLAGAVVVLGVVYWLFTYAFPPDPRAVALINATNDIDRRIATSDWPGALQIAETAYAQWPDDSELAAWVGVLAEKNGDRPRSAQAFVDVKRLTAAEPARYWLLRSEIFARVGDSATAFESAQAALRLGPENPEATFAVGRTAAEAGDRAMALEYLDKTFQLAEESNPQLALNARVLWGTLIQQPDIPTPDMTTTP